MFSGRCEDLVLWSSQLETSVLWGFQTWVKETGQQSTQVSHTTFCLALTDGAAAVPLRKHTSVISPSPCSACAFLLKCSETEVL